MLSCPNDNLECHQWRQSCQIDDHLFSYLLLKQPLSACCLYCNGAVLSQTIGENCAYISQCESIPSALMSFPARCILGCEGTPDSHHNSSISTLNMLNCFKEYKRYIHIFCHILELVQKKKTKFTMEQPFLLPILSWQYHACWCSGDFRSQGISRHGIDPKAGIFRFQHRKS